MSAESSHSPLSNADGSSPPEDPLPGGPHPDRQFGWRFAPAILLLPADVPAATAAATVSPVYLGLGLVAATLAGLGTLAAACLVGYSPARLSQLLEEEQRSDREQRNDEIARRDIEYLVVATVYSATGWTVGLWSLLYATDDAARPWVLGVFLALMLLFAGSLPAAIAQERAERTVLSLLPFVRGGWYLLRWPLVVPLLTVTRLLMQLFRLGRSKKNDPGEVQRQVMAAVADSVTEDSLAQEERTWIGNIVGLKDLQVSTVMTPRPDIVAFDVTLAVRDAVLQALEQGFSRYPVYRERLDEVVGIFYVKDALKLLKDDAETTTSDTLASIMREPLFVPETMGAAQLLRRFQAGNQHMAIVLDEYGTTAGLATVEDLIEEIVGDISDEYDSPHQDAPEEEQIQIVEAGRVLEIPARATVAEINQLLGTDLPEDGDWETVAGLVIAHCNHIPTIGETVVVDGVEFRVLLADERRLLRLRATAVVPEPAEDSR
ncbi:MAG: HlyC/CorC family transporter [Planctomycetes bacterium]|nr:HlyC/CorC family transporter [Planctomycetota bacterium]